MARMSIDDKFLRDPRVTRLADALGWSRYEARGRLLDVFAVCYDLETDIITPEDANAAADEARLADAMIAVGLADQDDGGIRVHGAVSRIEYLVKKAEAGRKGGLKSAETRRKKSEAKRSSASPKPEAVGNPPDPDPDLPPDPDLQISLPRAIPPNTESAPVPAAPPATAWPSSGDPAHQPTREDRKAVRDAIRAEINAARARVGAKLGTPLHPVLPFDRGLDSDLTGQLALATTRADLDALATQARHAVAMAELEAIAEPERVQFLTGAIFSGGNFARLAGKTAETARAGPKRSAARAEQPTIRPKTTDDEPPIPSWE